MGSLGERTNVPSPCNWSLQSNMAKPRQVQSGAYVGTLLSPQRLQTRLKQRFFQIPLKRTFFQCDLQGSPEFPVSLPSTPPPKCQRGVPTTRRGSEARTALPQLYWREEGGPVFHCWCGFSGPHTLGGPIEDSCSTKQVRMGMGRRGSHMQTQTRARGMPSPPPPDIVASPPFPPPVHLARDRTVSRPRVRGHLAHE